MRAHLVGIVLLAATACDQLGLSDGSRGGNSLVSTSGGEIALADGGSLEFGITSDQYKSWDRARKGISKRVAARFGAILQPDAPTERSIERAVAYLDSEASARRAIESAGMSTRAFVVMTVALEQEMRRASGQPVVRQPDPAPSPYDFPMVDTTMIAPITPAPVYPVDTFGRVPPVNPPVAVDTALPVPVTSTPPVIVPPTRDTTVPRPPTIFRRDSARPVRPDTARPIAPRPDTPRRDTTPAPPRPPADTGAGPAAEPLPAPTPPDSVRMT